MLTPNPHNILNFIRNFVARQGDAPGLPLLGRIAAGHPIEAIPDEDTLNLSEFLLGPNRFALRVQGDSMREAGILHGDTAIIQRRETAADGDIVVALIDNEEATLKRLYHLANNRIKLVAENRSFAPMYYSAERVRIQGVLVIATGTCIITCSYEARAHGVKTGMRLKEARKLCPELIQAPARPQRYADVSSRIMASLEAISPDIEIFSVDEAFLDITRCQRLLGPPTHIAKLTKQVVYEAAGILCSVGVSGDKTTAKYAAKLHKPDGLTVIPPWEARARLQDVAVTELCGINKGIGRFLAERGIYTCGDMARLPIGVLAKRFGNPGRRIWYMAQGADPAPLQTSIPAPKTIGHGKVMPPDTRDPGVISTYLLHMSEKVAARLRRHALAAQLFVIALRARHGWIGDKARTAFPTDDGSVIAKLCRQVIERCWHGQGVHQVQVTALDPRPGNAQLELFPRDDPAVQHKADANTVVDRVNQRYGEFTLAPARLLHRSTMPNVIAPAWRPFGHRQTIQDAGADTLSSSSSRDRDKTE